MTVTPSPCIRNCCLDDGDICLGCFGSIEEIMQWSGADERLKRHILKQAQARRDSRSIKKAVGLTEDDRFGR